MSQQNEKKLSIKQKVTIANVFRKIFYWFVKPEFQEIKQQYRLYNQIHGLIILHFHIYNLTQPIPADQIRHNSFSVPPQSILSPMMTPLQSPVSQQMKWNSSMSTFQYKMVLLPNNVRKCYGCSQSSTDCYRHHPKNIFIRHRDRRITGKNISGDLTCSSDFQFTNYHLSRDHAVRKIRNFENNPYVYAS